MAMFNPNMAYLGGNRNFDESAAPGFTQNESNIIGGGFNWNQYTGGEQTGSSWDRLRNLDPNDPEYWSQAAVQARGGNTGVNGNIYTGSGLTGGSSGAWDQNRFMQEFGSPGTPQELEALEQRLNAVGIRVSRNAAGVAGKIILPNGQYVDVINSAGLGGRGFQWLTDEGGSGGGQQGGSAQPYNFSTDDPSYKFRLQEGMDALQKSAAARGTLLTGGTLKDLTNYAQGAASQEYGAAFGRKATLADMGLRAAGGQVNSAGAYGNNATNQIGNIGNANSAGSIGQGNIWGPYFGTQQPTVGTGQRPGWQTPPYV